MPNRNDSRQKRTRFIAILSILRKRKLYRGLTPEKLRLILEDLGTTFMKLGQIMSMREDLLPADYCRELSKLRTKVAPIPTAEVRSFIEDECGLPMESLFSGFEDEPVGAASIAQVHNAVLKDGSAVVVKVQRPGIQSIMEQDISILLRAAGLLNRLRVTGDLIDFKMVLNEMWQVAQQEMDFVAEAKNLEEFAERNANIAYVSCPKVYLQYSNRHILIMERVNGIPIDDIDALGNQGYDIKDLSTKLTENYVKQIVDDAYFHADPHPGNILIRDGQIVWIDMGMMGRLKERDRVLIKRAMAAFVDHDVITVKEVLLTLGVASGRVNHALLHDDIDEFLNKYARMTLHEATPVQMSEIMNEIMTMAKVHGISIPDGVSMLGRGMIIFEGLLLRLDPHVDLITIFVNYFAANRSSSADLKKLLTDSVHSLYGSMKKGADLPAQLSDLIKMTIKGHTKINCELSDFEEWNRMISSQVNKIVLAMLALALLIGSSILCTVPLSPTILKIPLPALIGYLLSFVLLVRVLRLMRKNK